MKHFYIFCIGLFLLQSCGGVDKLYARGDDEKVIEKVLRKERKHLAKQKEVQLAERAYARLHNDLIAQLERINNSDGEDKWVRLYNTADRIDRLQRKVEQYAPVRAKNGYEAEFAIVNVAELKEKSGKKAALFYFDRANEKLAIAKQTQKPHQKAREAYEDYQKVRRYDRSKDVSHQMEEAKRLGTVRVATQIGREVDFRGIRLYNSGYDNKIERELERMLNFNGSQWIHRVHGSPIGQNVDYIISLNLRDVDFSNVRQRTDENTYSKQISEQVRDANGNVVVDSLGNAILHYSTIHATVRKTTYEKEAEVELQLNIIDGKTGHLVYDRRFGEDKKYEEETCHISGNEDAVPNNVRCRNQQIDFEDEEKMVEDLLEGMRSRVKHDIEHQINRLQ